MELYWIAQPVTKTKSVWFLVSVNETGHVLNKHAKVYKHIGKWHWITQPPVMRRGTALTHDDARREAEEALRDVADAADVPAPQQQTGTASYIPLLSDL